MTMKSFIKCMFIIICIFFIASCSYDYVNDYDIKIDDSFNVNKNDTIVSSKNNTNNKATGTISFGVSDVNKG